MFGARPDTSALAASLDVDTGARVPQIRTLDWNGPPQTTYISGRWFVTRSDGGSFEWDAIRVEEVRPWDYGRTLGNGRATLVGFAPGTRTVTARIVFSDGSTDTLQPVFTAT